jgi:filamentous hemagglutinin
MRRVLAALVGLAFLAGPALAAQGAAYPAPQREVSDVTVLQYGKAVFHGTVDLGPTLDRIARGEKSPYRHDGTVFGNREGRLPKKPSGWYREYVIPTAGVSGPGPQRLVVGRDGEVFYTPDHYETFRQLNERKR